MDGHYVPLDALTRWFLADVAARQGVQSTILGFSFNHHPPAWLRYALNSISNRVAIKVRDPISLERFQRFTRARAELVADVAFLLEPRGGSQAAERIQEWAQRRRSEGDVVLGFNIHPMLIRDMDGARVRALVDGARRGLTEIMEHGGVSVLLIPHDDRGTKGDLVCLAPLRETLAGRFGDRVTGPASGLGAAELKAAVGSTDAVITGRMHLAIAALGQGKPVGVLTYQDKFQGLFELFGLPKRLLIDPESRTFSGDLYAAIAYLLQERSGLEQLVTSRLPGIRVMARGNFDARA
jgi:polysaccharide pyruvyl transferase WcaK-like protein